MAEEAESLQPTVRLAIGHFMSQHMDRKKSAPGCYRISPTQSVNQTEYY